MEKRINKKSMIYLILKKIKEEYIKEGKEYLENEKYETLKANYLEILIKAKEKRKKDLSTNAYKKE